MNDYRPDNLRLWTMPDNYAGEVWPDYYRSGVGQSRDSDALERSNFMVMLDMLGGETETVIVVRESHWAVGWVEWIAIHVSDEKALRIADEQNRRLENYPVLDEENFSELEWNEAAEYWNSESPRGKVQMAMQERSRYHWLADEPVWRFGRMSFHDLTNDGSTIAEALYEMLRAQSRPIGQPDKGARAMNDMTDYDAIRAQIVAMCKAPLELGKPVPEKGYTPKRYTSKDGEKITLRYSTPFAIAGYSGSYTGPVDGRTGYLNSMFADRKAVLIGGDWFAYPKGDPAPKHGDVLSSLLMDAQAGSETFEEFCSSFGYDSDSRKAEATWRECQSCLGAMRRAFGADLEAATELAYQL